MFNSQERYQKSTCAGTCVCARVRAYVLAWFCVHANCMCTCALRVQLYLRVFGIDSLHPACRDNMDPVTGKPLSKGPSWKSLTKGLWSNKDVGGTADEGRDSMGQSWSQLTDGLWDNEPYKERNGLEY